MNYLHKLKFYCPKPLQCNDIDLAIPHQSISPREILEHWVRNDADTDIHTPVEDWRGGDVHPNSIREFEDNFEALEYISEITSSPVTLDNLHNSLPADYSEGSSGPEPSEDSGNI